jgi:hypothetical protein
LRVAAIRMRTPARRASEPVVRRRDEYSTAEHGRRPAVTCLPQTGGK